MIVSLVAHGHAFFRQTPAAFGVDTQTSWITRRHGIVPEYPAHVVEQLGCCQHHRWITELVEAVKEKSRVLVTLGGGAGQPFLGLLMILLYIMAQEVQLAQCVLGKLISLFCGGCQISQRFLYILWYGLAGEIDFAKTVRRFRQRILLLRPCGLPPYPV